MSKYSRNWNEAIYQKYIREGRGQGSRGKYKPWILVRNFASKGMVSRINGVKTGRIHHLMSNNELHFFYLLDWSDEVIDIREQFPLLELQRIIEIAEKAHIQYPYDNKSGFPYVLTSDFFIETTRGFEVVTIKESTELKKLRVREKLEIERRYWNEKNVKWSIVTEKEIDQIKAKNIEWLSQARDLGRFCISERLQKDCIEYFLMRFFDEKSSLNVLFDEIELKFNFKSGMALNIYKHLIYWKRIKIDVSKEIDWGYGTAFAVNGYGN